MRKNTTFIGSFLATALLAMVLSGCTPTLRTVTQSREVYVTTLHELNALQNAGKLDQKTHDAIEPARLAAEKALDDAEAAARNGSAYDAQKALDAANVALNALIAAQQTAKAQVK